MADVYSPAGKVASAGSSILSMGGLGAKVLGAGAKFLPYVGPIIMGLEFVNQLIGRGRKQADIWTKSVQEPFGRRMSEIIDPVNAARAAGTLTYEQAQAALAQFESEVAGVESAAQQFEALGSKQRTVIDQFRRQFAGPGYTEDWRRDLTAHVEALKPAETKGPEPPPEEAPQLKDVIPGGETPEKVAKKAAIQQKKRATAAFGRSSTILGGAQGRPATRQATILGY